jgi:hypothetical protein
MNDTVAIELILPKETYLTLKQAAEEKNKTEAELVIEAIRVFLSPWTHIDPFLGLFADEPELIDEVTTDVMRSRAETSLRLPEM